MKLSIKEFSHNSSIPGEFAFAIPDIAQHVALSDNKNPSVSWSDAPEKTKSFVLLCVDRDVPSKPDDVNQEGREVPKDLPRCDFYHWVMVDIPKSLNHIDAGSCSEKVVAHGKKNPDGPEGSRQGINDYTQWFNGDEAMHGEYYGYDGPCPPWNDSIVHHYHFILYATDLDRCEVDSAFTGPDVISALEGHVLAKAEVIGIYSLNPRLIS